MTGNEMTNPQTTSVQSANGQNRALDYVDPAAVAAAEAVKARIQAAYTMAAYHPRNEDQARVRILAACRRPAFAERVEYSKPVGKDYRTGEQQYISGPSIRFAEECIRAWGNIDCQNQVVYEDEEVRRVRITVTDLETNSSLSKEIQLSKNVERKSAAGREVVRSRLNSYGKEVFIVRATDEEMQTKTDAAISKALRNEGLRLIPQDIVDEAIDTARETMRRRDAEDPQAAKKRLIDGFYTLGVQPEQLTEYVGHDLRSCTPAELADLRKVFSAIRSGEAKWSDFTTPPEGNDEAGDAADLAKKKLEDLKKRRSTKSKAPAEPPPMPDPEPEDEAAKAAVPPPTSFRMEMEGELPLSDENGGV